RPAPGSPVGSPSRPRRGAPASRFDCLEHDDAVNPIRVLLADDHPVVLGGLDHFLSLEPDIAVVARCTNGDDALSAHARERPHVAVLDLTMPRRSGMDLLRELDAAHSPVRVVLLTARI